MAYEEDKKDEEQFGFDSAGQGYISLEQAQVVAARNARENRDFYGRRYARRDMIWEQARAEEGEDYYYVRLSFRPAGRFRGEPGIERFTINKTGPVELREIIQEVVEPRNWGPLLAAGGVLALVVAIVGGLFAAGVIRPTPSPSPAPVTSIGAAPSTPTATPSPETATTLAPIPTLAPSPLPTLPAIVAVTPVPTAAPPILPTATATAVTTAITSALVAPTPVLASPPLPDLTVELLYQPTKVDCSGGPGNCDIRVDLKIDNIGLGTTPDDIKYLVKIEGEPDLVLSTGGGTAIAPGGTTGGFFVTLGPGNNCFNPDCTVAVTVDPNNEIAESNEVNNTARRTDRPPDLTVELLYPPAKVDCAAGPNSCAVRVDLQINNVGAGIAPGDIKYLVAADGMPDLILNTGGGTAIAPGGTTGGFFVTLGPGPNCFNPDCTVSVTVDPGNQIAESNEANNTAERTDRGSGSTQQRVPAGGGN